MGAAEGTWHSQGLASEPVFDGRAWVAEAGPRDAPGLVLIHGLGDAGARDLAPVRRRLLHGIRRATPDRDL